MHLKKFNKIILGTAQFKSGYGAFNKNKITKNEASNIIKISKKYNIKSIDTANSYGNLFNKLDKNQLSDLKIIYKFKPFRNNNYKSFLSKLLNKNFKFHHLYCFMLHDEKDLKKFKKENIKLIEKLKKQKKLKKLGISIYDFSNLDKIILDKDIDIIQIPFNIFDKRFLRKKIQNAIKKRKKKLEVHARSIFLQGLLLQKTNNKNKIIQQNQRLFQKWDKCNNYNLDLKIFNCINFVKNTKNIDKMVIGFDSPGQLKMLFNILNRLKKKKKLKFNYNIKENVIDPRRW